MLSSFLFTLFTNDCVSVDQSVLVTKFSDDTTVDCCIENADETACRDKVERMVGWCADNNLKLNVSKTKEMIVDFRRKKTLIRPLSLNGVEVEQVESFRFLGTTISSDLSWDKNTLCITKKAQQRLYFLRQPRRFGIAQEIMIRFYRTIIESIIIFSIVVWFGRAGQEEKQQLDAIVKGASRIIGSELPSIEYIYQARCAQKSRGIAWDTTHPANHLFELLPSGKRYRSVKTRTTRHKNSFYPQAVRHLN